MTTSGSAQQTAHEAHDSHWIDKAATGGLVAYGVVYLVLGWLSVQLALGDRAGSASTTGAVQELAQKPFGEALVWAVVVGMALLVVWRGLEAAVGHRDEDDDKKRAAKRALSAGKAVVYAFLGFSAAKIVTSGSSSSGSSGSSGGGSSSDTLTAQVMDWPGGQAIVVVVGLAVIGFGVAQVVYAFKDKHLENVRHEALRGSTGRVVKGLGRAGYTAKGVGIGAVGALVVYAGATHEAKKSGGLDQALRTLLDQTLGPVLVALVGIGFAAYGVFCFVRARYLDR